MSADDPVRLTSDTPITDRMMVRWDWEGMPRFYWVRLYDHEDGCKVYVELEGDPTAHHDKVCDDDSDQINESTLDCIAEIEWQCEEQWDREQEAERRDCLTSYERQFGY